MPAFEVGSWCLTWAEFMNLTVVVGHVTILPIVGLSISETYDHRSCVFRVVGRYLFVSGRLGVVLRTDRPSRDCGSIISHPSRGIKLQFHLFPRTVMSAVASLVIYEPRH